MAKRSGRCGVGRAVAMAAALAAGGVGAVARGAAVDGGGAAVEHRVDELLAKLAPADRIKLLAGIDGFYTRDVPAAGLPRFKFTDGPVGTRNDGPSTAYPAGVCLAATWDPAIAEREGVALGRDARCRGDHVLLGPGVNICRAPMNGRDFEYLGEDPLLAARMDVGYIRGVQSQGVSACVKHYAANNEEVDRMTVNAVVSERALQEIYLPAFEAAIRDGHCHTIMAAYNRINGDYATANHYLETTVLRDQWHFDGLAMSDWGAVHDALGPLNAGLDLEMPGPEYLKPATVAALVAEGKVTQASIDEKVRRLLRVAVQMGWLDRPQKDASIAKDDAANDAVALDVAREGITLLKDEGGLLPLDKAKLKRVVVLGPDADAYVAGGGSSFTKPARPVTLLAGLQAAAPGVQFDRIPFHGDESGHMRQMARDSKFDGGELTATFYSGIELAGTPLLTRQDKAVDFNWKGSPGAGVPHDNFSARWVGHITPSSTGPMMFAIRSDDGSRVKLDGKTILDSWSDHRPETVTATVPVVAGRPYEVAVEYYQKGGEAIVQFGCGPVLPALAEADRQSVASADAAVVLVHTSEGEGSDRPYALPDAQAKLIAAVAAANPRTIVVLESGANVAMKDWVDHVPALVDAWFPGQAGGKAIGEVLFGDVNPSGHLPDTFEKDWPDSPAYGHFPGVNGKVEYAEGIYVGYRGFDKRGIAPRFPFGYGLSYTTFDMANPKVTASGDGDGRTFAVTVDVTNTGKTAGATVAQLYVRPPAGEPVDRPPQELKGFARVALQPGETKPVTMTLDRRSFAHWDEATHGWQVVPGKYELAVGRNSRDVCCTTAVDWK
jgi:beta-glucosidase